MYRSSFRNIYNVYFYPILFATKIPKIVESRKRLSFRTAVTAHGPVFKHSETQYSHGYKSLRPGVGILGDTVSAQRPKYTRLYQFPHTVGTVVQHMVCLSQWANRILKVFHYN